MLRRSRATHGRQELADSAGKNAASPVGDSVQSAVSNEYSAATVETFSSSKTCRTVSPALVATSKRGGEAEMANSIAAVGSAGLASSRTKKTADRGFMA